MRSEPMLILALCSFTLVACQQGADIRIDQKDGHATFSLSRASGDKPACVRNLEVYEGEPKGAPPLWQIAGGDEGCVSTVTFASVPKGFSQADGTPAGLRLKPGQHYAVQASGTGWMAFGGFTAR
jgi:hypothetical protein